MNNEKVFVKVAEVCKKVFGNSQLVITSDTNANDIENWDSMTNLFLIDSLEKEFDIKFSLDDIFNAQNVGDLCSVILQKQS